MDPGLKLGRTEEEINSPDQRKLLSAGGGNLDSECCKHNGIINTRNVMVGTKEGRVSVYSAPKYQGHMMVSHSPQPERQDRNGTHKNSHPRQLNPNTLSVDSFYRPNLILYPDGKLRVFGEGGDCCETTFIEDMTSNSGTAVTKDGLMLTDNKFLDLSVEDAKIHTLSYDVDDEDDDFQELEVGLKMYCRGQK